MNLYCNKSQFLRTVFNLFPVVLVLLGCSGSSVPNESMGRKYLQNSIQKQSVGRVKIVSFSKTNGMQRERMGMRLYKLAWRAEIEFTDDCYFGPYNMDGSWSGDFVTTKQKPSLTFTPLKAVKKGEHMKFSGDYTFVKTEKGWQGEDGNMY